jgi:hypothetical protein
MGESDRASIILMAALLDDTLSFTISRNFCEAVGQQEKDPAFRFDGPLGTFSSKIEIAALFGLIDDRVCDQLHTVRELRNACAHSRHGLRFTDAILLNVVERIFHPIGFHEFPRAADSREIKSSFLDECLLTRQILISGSRAEAEKVILDNPTIWSARPPSQ